MRWPTKKLRGWPTSVADSVEDVTLGEIVRTLADLREEIRALRGEHVRRDLYEAHRAAVAADIERLTREIDRLEKEIALQEQQRSNRGWAVNLAVIGAGLSLLTQFIVLLAR